MIANDQDLVNLSALYIACSMTRVAMYERVDALAVECVSVARHNGTNWVWA